MNTRTVQYLLDKEWIVAIQEEIISNPAGVAFNVEPEALGQYDAEMGLPCDPTGRGYRKLGDIETYIVSYNDTAALWAEMVEKANDELPDAAFFEAELMDLLDGMDEAAWIRGGC